MVEWTIKSLSEVGAHLFIKSSSFHIISLYLHIALVFYLYSLSWRTICFENNNNKLFWLEMVQSIIFHIVVEWDGQSWTHSKKKLFPNVSNFYVTFKKSLTSFLHSAVSIIQLHFRHHMLAGDFWKSYKGTKRKEKKRKCLTFYIHFLT